GGCFKAVVHRREFVVERLAQLEEGKKLMLRRLKAGEMTASVHRERNRRHPQVVLTRLLRGEELFHGIVPLLRQPGDCAPIEVAFFAQSGDLFSEIIIQAENLPLLLLVNKEIQQLIELIEMLCPVLPD